MLLVDTLEDIFSALAALVRLEFRRLVFRALSYYTVLKRRAFAQEGRDYMFDTLLALCRDRPVYVQTHNFPDPDALASAYGLCRLLEASGIKAIACYDGQLDKRAGRKMVEVFGIKAVPVHELGPLEADAFVLCVDSQKGNGNITPLSVGIQACIDHHPIFVASDYVYQDIRTVGACATLVASYFREAGVSPDASTAACLLFGIQNDTRQFSRGVSSLDIDMFGYLNRLSNAAELRALTSSTMAFSDLKAYVSAIDTFRVYADVGFSEVEYPCSDDLIAMISDFFLSLDGINLSVVFNRRADGIKFSVRSKQDTVDAGKLTNLALRGLGSGGGHPYMAGGVIATEHESELGVYPDEIIRDLFLDALQRLRCDR